MKREQRGGRIGDRQEGDERKGREMGNERRKRLMYKVDIDENE